LREREREREREMGNAFCIFCGCVDQASIGVVERWGRFEKLAEPGLHFFNPFAGECLAGVLSTRINSLDVRIETKTKVSFLSQLLRFFRRNQVELTILFS
jgi:regulator of protease activity HflC (stomatin/prohibitin superfamily)